MSDSYLKLQLTAQNEADRRQAAEQDVALLRAEVASQQREIARLNIALQQSQQRGIAMRDAAAAAMRATDTSHL